MQSDLKNFEDNLMDYYTNLDRSGLRDNNTLYVVRVLVLVVLVLLDSVLDTVIVNVSVVLDVLFVVVLDVLGVAVILDDAV